MAKIVWKSESEILEEEMLKALEPTKDEVEKAKLKLEILETIMEVGLI